MPNGKPVTFKWSNYTKPTPRNLKMFMEFWKGAIVVVTGTTIYQDAPDWISITILLLGYAVDRVAKFFAYVEEEESKRSITVEFPARMADEVTITEESTTGPKINENI